MPSWERQVKMAFKIQIDLCRRETKNSEKPMMKPRPSSMKKKQPQQSAYSIRGLLETNGRDLLTKRWRHQF